MKDALDAVVFTSRSYGSCLSNISLSTESPHLRSANDQNGISGEAYHFFGYAPQHPTLYARTSVRAHGYKVIRRSLAEANDLTGSGAFGYGGGNLFDPIALQFRDLEFDVILRLVL